MTLATCSKINSKLVLIKLHYFFFFGGLAGYLPYGTLIAKSLNINATAIGLLFTVLNCIVMFSKPIVGYLVDYYRNIKLFLSSFILVLIITGLCVLLITPINRGIKECENKELEVPDLPEVWTQSQRTHAPEDCLDSSKDNCTFSTKIRNTSETNVDHGFKLKSHESNNLTGFSNYSNITDSQLFDFTKLILCDSNNFSSNCETNQHFCSIHKIENFKPVYKFYQFWIFSLLLILRDVTLGNGNSLSDVACYEMLGNQRQLYGFQRLFGTIGWAIICPLSGILNQMSSDYISRDDYSPGILLAVDFFIVSKITAVKSKVSTDMSGDLKKVMRSGDIILFSVGAIAIGILTSIVSNFEFWYLQDLGASQTLMGTAVFMQCLIEVPFFTVSAWFVKKFGSFNCLALSFGAFVIRCGLYYSIHNPWWALAIDMTHGLTFALFHFSMTNFASMNAPEGMEATVLGILSGLTNGLGSAAGNLLGGVALDIYGGRLMFCFASVFSAACAVCIAILPKIIIKNQNTSSKKPYECETVDIEETMM